MFLCSVVRVISVEPTLTVKASEIQHQSNQIIHKTCTKRPDFERLITKANCLTVTVSANLEHQHAEHV